MTAKRRCPKEVWHETGFHHCLRPATIERDGKRYCWQHDPERVKADAEKRRAIREIKRNVLVALWKRRAHNARLAELVTPKLAALLERLSSWDVLAPRTTSERDRGRELATRIREALEADE